MESLGHNSCNGVTFAIDAEVPTYSMWIFVIVLLPQAIAEDHRRRSAGLIFFRTELPPHYRRNAKGAEELGRNPLRLPILWLSCSRKIDAGIHTVNGSNTLE